MTLEWDRRTVLGAGLLGGGTLVAALAGCAPGPPDPTTSTDVPPAATSQGSPDMNAEASTNTLLVYFSRAGENYYNGCRRVLDVGNTEVLAGMIGDRIGCDVYRIVEADAYPESYEETVERNRDDQNTNARPAIANPLPDVSAYGTVLLGSPVWNMRAPMIMSSFLDGVDLDCKRVLPFVTYAVSGIGGIEQDYRGILDAADVLPGLAVRGEETADAGPALEDWLRQSGLNI